MLRTIVRYAAVALTCGGLAAGLAPAGAHAAEAVSVRLNWIPGTEHSFFYLGKEKGWFAEAGFDLEIIAGQGSTVAVKTTGAGESTFAVADVASVARGWEAGVPIVAVAVLLKESPAAIYSLKEKGIATMADLCGRSVGINIKSTTTEQYRAMVREAALKDCTISEVPISGGGGKEVLSGAVDAAVTFAYEDPLQIKVKGHGVNQIVASEFFRLYSLGLITHEDTVAERKDMVDRFVAVTLKSLHYALDHPEEAKAAFLKTAPEADLAYENAKFDVFAGLLTADDPSGGALGVHDAAGWQSSLATLHDLGIVKSRIDPAGKYVLLAD